MKISRKILYYVLILLIIASGYLIPLIPIFTSNSWSYNLENTSYQTKATISSNGEYIVGTADNEIILFHISNPVPLWSYETSGPIASVVISSNGDYLATFSGSERMFLFNKDNPNPIWVFDGDIRSLSISSDGHYIAAGADGAVHLFNIVSSTPVWSYPTISGIETIDIDNIAISKDSNYIAACAQNSTVFLFNRTHSKPIWKYSTGSPIYSVAISAIGEYIALGNRDHVYLFNQSSANPIWNCSVTEEYIQSVAISDNGNYIVAGSGNDPHAYLFSKNSSTPLFTYESSEIGEIAFHHATVDITSDGSRIFVGFLVAEKSHIDIFNNYGSEYLQRIKHDRSEFIAVSSDGKHIVSIGMKSMVYFDINTPIIFSNYLSTFLGIIIPLAIGELILIAIFIPYKINKRKRFREREQRRYTQIISEKIIDENKIDMGELKQRLDIDDKIFDKQVLEWTVKYNLTIDGDHIIVDKDNVDDLIKALEVQFKKWEKKSEKKF